MAAPAKHHYKYELDLRGREVLLWNKEMETYDLSVLEKGIYFLKISSKNNLLHTRKIIKY